MTRAVIYARYSSHAQNDESIEQQVDECERYAKAHNMTIVEIYADRALTGRSDRRPEFQRMIRAAETGAFSTVIAYKSNRIARNMLHALQYESKLDKSGVRIVYCREEFGDTATGRFMLRSMMNLNQFYSENMAEDVIRGMNENAKKHRINGRLPYGYKRGDDGKYVIDEQTAPIVHEIFERLASGERQIDIVNDLNRRCIPTASGGKWQKTSFGHMIANERYKGVYVYHDIRDEGAIPAIIEPELFDRVGIIMRRQADAVMSRRRTPGVVYILTGKLFCGPCGSKMTGISGKGHLGTSYQYYRCTGCGETRIRRDYIEDIVIQILRECVMDDSTIDLLVNMAMQYRREVMDSDGKQRDALEARLREVKTAKVNIIRAIESGAVSKALTDRLTQLERDEIDLGAQLEIERRRSMDDVTEDMVRYYFIQFRAGDINDPAYDRLLIDTFLRAVYVYPDRIDVTFSFDDEHRRDVSRPIITESVESDGVSLTSNLGDHFDLKITLRRINHILIVSIPRR